MIKNRNIASDAGIEPSKIAGGGGMNYPREIHYVAKTADTVLYEYLGRTVPSGNLHPNITSAMGVVPEYGIVVVYPGQYVETATITIPYDGVSLVAAQMGPNKALIRTEIRQHGGTDTPCITIDGVHNVEVAGIRITPYSSNTGTGISVGASANTYGTYIHDNYFYCVEVGDAMANAITMGVDGSYDCDSTYISNNHFFAGGNRTNGVGIIEWNSATRSVIEDNTFFQYTNHSANYAINIYDAAGYRGQIYDNKFFAAEIGVTAKVCVAINNPTVVGGDVIIDGNKFVGYSGDDQCIASSTDPALGLNYHNEDVVAGS